MRTRIALTTVTLAAFAALAAVPEAGAGPWGLARGEWYSSFEGSTFTADTYHLADGVRDDLGYLVETRELRSHSELGWKRNLTFVFELPLLSVTHRFPFVQGTATGFQDLLIGARWNATNGPGALAVELGWTVPAGYTGGINIYGQYLGDGLQQLDLAVDAGHELFGRGFVQGELGYGYRYLGIGQRSSDPFDPADPHLAKYAWADGLVMEADVAVWLGESVLAAGRYQGSTTLSHGALFLDSNVHLLGPMLLFRVDDRIDLYAGSWSTAAGSNTLHYDQVYVGVAFHRTGLNRLQGFLGGRQSP